MKGSRFMLALVLFAGVSSLASANAEARELHSLPELTTRDLCLSNVAFDYSAWQFRKGYKALCCAACKSGGMDRVCLNAYDSSNKLYNACAPKTPESDAICTHPNAPIPSKPLAPRPAGLPELETRNLCRSNIAFDYKTWTFRTGYKSLCCHFCAAGSMEPICLNVYDACGKRYNACAAQETKNICTQPHAPIPAQPSCTSVVKSRGLSALPELETRDLCVSNIAFDYNTWAFRTGYKSLCCKFCKSGSMVKTCLNAYDANNKLYNACAARTPESTAPCKDPEAPIPERPHVPAKPAGLPELVTRDTCRSNLAFDYATWQFRTGYKSLCCHFCAAGSMEPICLNSYDACGRRYNACASKETTAPCTNPTAPIPAGPPVCTRHRSLLSGAKPAPKPSTPVPGVPEVMTRDTCESNIAFNYMTWQFRKGYKALCCGFCSAGSMSKICLNAYDDNNKLYNACDAEESEEVCTDVNAPIPDHPVVEEHRPSYTSSNSLPELLTRDICVSNLAFDYTTWQYRTGFKSLCCSYCRAGSMERPCLNAYDACGNRYFACSSAETTAPCTDPHAPIPAGYPYQCHA